MVTSLKRSHACTATFSAPSPATGHHRPTPPPETPRHSQASLGQSPVESLLLSPGSWCTRFCLCPPRVHFPVLRKFWQLCGGINGDLLQEGLCCTQVSCTQSLCPCARPWPTCTSTGDTQTQFCLSLCGVPRPWCAQDLFEPSEHLWWEWGLILNAILPELLLCLWMWGISTWPVQQSTATAPDLGRGVSHSQFHILLIFPLLQLEILNSFNGTNMNLLIRSFDR